jgi:hypothetical protein
MLRQSCYNNDGSESVFLSRKMSQRIRVGKKSKAGEKGDGRCYFPCKKCFLTFPITILIATTTIHCRKYGYIDGGSNEYCPMVISYIFIICFYIVNFIQNYIYVYILFGYLL